MSDDQLDDLKQFFTITASQSEATITHELRGEIIELRSEMVDNFGTIGDLITTNNDTRDEHDQRIMLLEAKAA